MHNFDASLYKHFKEDSKVPEFTAVETEMGLNIVTTVKGCGIPHD